MPAGQVLEQECDEAERAVFMEKLRLIVQDRKTVV